MTLKNYLICGALLCIPGYTWLRLYREWKKLREEYAKNKLFMERHNCVVMYKPNCEITGWPESEQNSKRQSLSGKYEPILHFIRTSQVSLDVAVMIINVQCIIDELLIAVKRKVKVRIITDNAYFSKPALEQLSNAGIPMLYYVSPNTDGNNLFHLKYVIKDGSYLCIGSMNWTVTSVMQNYENINFISNHKIVNQFYNNFEKCWLRINQLNNSSSYAKAQLRRDLVQF